MAVEPDRSTATLAEPAPAPWGALAIMVGLAIMSMVDRLILALLVKPLRAGLHLSDIQLGVLFGTAFALFYGLLGLPLARVADQFNRARLVTVAVLLWSLCTILSGFATQFWQLLVLRAGLALGEAALFPAVHSLIYDMFDARRRPLAAAIAMAGPGVGGAITFMAGGVLVGLLEQQVASGGGHGFQAWQLAFFAVGIPSLILGLLFGAVVREPARCARRDAAPISIVAALRGRRMMFFWLLFAGGVCQIMPYAYQAWAPSLLTDKYGLTIGIAGLTIGISSALGSVLGILILPPVALRRYDRGHRTALATVPLIAIVVGTTVYCLAPLQPAVGFVLASVLIGNFALLGSNAVIVVAMQRLAPDNLRATMVAGTLLVSSSLGLGVGPVMIAYLAHAFGAVARFDMALSWLAAGSGALGVGLFLLARRQLRRQMPAAAYSVTPGEAA